jgi:hypothetical protein
MLHEDPRRRSRFILRVQEWDEPKARYPNLWHDDMPRHVMAFDTVAGRLRLGDLVAVFHPTSRRRPERSNRFLGLARVAGLRRADAEGYSWVDLETEHKFTAAPQVEDKPRRVFLCCDPGWPDGEVALFQKLFDTAVAQGWKPGPNDELEGAETARVEEVAAPAEPAADDPADEPSEAEAPTPEPTETAPAWDGPTRHFGGVDYSGDMRDPRDATWLAISELRGDALHLVRLEATGRHGLQSHLRDPDSTLMHAEAIGLDFPFGIPLGFAERILDGPFPDEGWWALVRRFERMSRPDYLVAIQEYRDAQGEDKRLTDEHAKAFSPLHRVNPDLGPMTYHGIRMIGEERSRYAVKPFESAQGKLLLEVYPGELTRRLDLGGNGGKGNRREAMIQALAKLEHLPVIIDASFRRVCLASRDALDAVIASRCAAAAVLSGEAEKSAEALAPEHADRVKLEGWIYGLEA